MARDLWDLLEIEIALWQAQNTRIPVWWRDDDATRSCAALDDLVSIADGLPVCLAVIPQNIDDSLWHIVEANPNLIIAQHGFSHENRAPLSMRKSEFGLDDHGGNLARIAKGQQILQDRFPKQLQKIFVPPWNRILPQTRRALEQSGVIVSCYSGTKDIFLTHQMMGYYRADCGGYQKMLGDCHINPLAKLAKLDDGGWGYGGDVAVLSRLICQIRMLRLHDIPLALGLLSHHLEHDQATWDFFGQLLRIARQTDAFLWVQAQ